ncbi:hypothetical protein B0H14DRAFT_3456915 [Mycena olivaceomarginata]|nr:hypothetical protein B0H14DRAFT_3456915 [Mycena olivaceomarginata]
MDSAPHRVWAPWNHPSTTAFSESLIGSKMLEDDTAVQGAMLDVLPALQYHHMAFMIPQEPSPLDFQSFFAAINNIFYFLDVVPQTWTRFLFKPSDEDAEKLFILPIDFKIPEIDYPNFTRAARDCLFAMPAPSPQKRTLTQLKRPSGVVSGVGPATGSTLLSIPAAKAASPPATLPEVVVKPEPKPPKASTSSNVEVVVLHLHDLLSDMPATPHTRSHRNIAPPPSKDLPVDPRCAAKHKASNESIASANAPLPITSAKKKCKGTAGKRAKSEATVHDVSDDEPEETADTKPKTGAKSNVVVVPRCRNAAQSQKIELNDVVDTDRLSDQILEYLNERVKKGAPRNSKVDLDFHDLDGNLPWTDQSAYLWGLRIHGTPVHFYSRLMPYSGARKTTEGYKSHFEAIPKIPSTIVEEPESACIQCILLGSECTPIAFGMSCSQCQQRDIKGSKNCEHTRTMEELIQFYCEISEKYAMTSDVTEMLLKNLRDAHHRTAGLAKLYAESSEELIDIFQHVSAHMEQVIDYVGADKFFSCFTDDKTLESLRGHLNELRANYNRRISDNSVVCEPDTIPAAPVPEGSHLITTDFATLGVAFANEGPSTLSPKRAQFKPAKSSPSKGGDSAVGPQSLSDIHHSSGDQEDVDMLADDAAGTSQPVQD